MKALLFLVLFTSFTQMREVTASRIDAFADQDQSSSLRKIELENKDRRNLGPVVDESCGQACMETLNNLFRTIRKQRIKATSPQTIRQPGLEDVTIEKRQKGMWGRSLKNVKDTLDNIMEEKQITI